MHFTLCPGSTACGYALFPPIHIPDLYPMSIGKSITTPAAIHQSRLSCVSLSQHFEPVYCVPIYPGNKHPVAFKQSIFITAPQFNKCCVEVLIHTCIYIYIYIAWCCWKSCINHIFTLYLYYICMLLHVYHIYQSQLAGVHGTTLRFAFRRYVAAASISCREADPNAMTLGLCLDI